jgi:hypothetical protein
MPQKIILGLALITVAVFRIRCKEMGRLLEGSELFWLLGSQARQ